MLRHHSHCLAAAIAFAFAIALVPALSAQAAEPTIVGPARIYLVDADSVFALATKAHQSPAVRHQEKLLRTALRLQYWRQHIPADMGMVFDVLGYPTGRVRSLPVGHEEEAWYYGQLQAPIRFRDGVLIDRDLFEALARP